MLQNIIKPISDKITSSIVQKVMKQKPYPQNSRVRQGIHYPHYYSISCWKSQPENKGKKRKYKGYK
jgi:hypothetical protein